MKELAETTASICSTDDCMMLTRAFNSAKTSRDALKRRMLLDTLTWNIVWDTPCGRILGGGWVRDRVGHIVDAERRNLPKSSYLYHCYRPGDGDGSGEVGGTRKTVYDI